MIKLSPSLLAADFSQLNQEISRVEEADHLHLDIMDGSYVPNITFGPEIISSLREKSDLIFDTHLMIDEPKNHLAKFVAAGSDLITVHAEATDHLHRVVQLINEHDCGAGVSLNPATPLSELDYILPELDLVLIMSVNPGAGGQKFIPEMYKKISDLKQIINERELDVEISVDGGIKLHNVSRVASAGADIIVAGSAIFKAENPAHKLKEFRQAVNNN